MSEGLESNNTVPRDNNAQEGSSQVHLIVGIWYDLRSANIPDVGT